MCVSVQSHLRQVQDGTLWQMFSKMLKPIITLATSHNQIIKKAIIWLTPCVLRTVIRNWKVQQFKCKNLIQISIYNVSFHTPKSRVFSSLCKAHF